MGLLSSVSRLFRNVDRVIEDVSPIVGAAAPFLIPGPGGFILSQLAQAGAAPQRAPTRPSVSAINAGAPLVRPTCRPMGVQGQAFSAPFQARNFPTGGAFPGRTVNPFGGGRVPVGRDIPKGIRCPKPAGPSFPGPEAVAIAEAEVAAVPPVPSVVVPRFAPTALNTNTALIRSRFGARTPFDFRRTF